MAFWDLISKKNRKVEPSVPINKRDQFLANLSVPGALEIAVTEATIHDSGPCPCCGSTTRYIQGVVTRDGIEWVGYNVVWTAGHSQHGTIFELVFGDWSRASTGEHRFAVCIEFRVIDGSPQFMIVDVSKRAMAKHPEFVSNLFDRAETIGTALAPYIFEVNDFIYIKDDRLAHLRGGV